MRSPPRRNQRRRSTTDRELSRIVTEELRRPGCRSDATDPCGLEFALDRIAASRCAVELQHSLRLTARIAKSPSVRPSGRLSRSASVCVLVARCSDARSVGFGRKYNVDVPLDGVESLKVHTGVRASACKGRRCAAGASRDAARVSFPESVHWGRFFLEDGRGYHLAVQSLDSLLYGGRVVPFNSPLTELAESYRSEICHASPTTSFLPTSAGRTGP